MTGDREVMKNPFIEANLSVSLLARDTAFYGAVSAVSKLSTVILVPLLTRTLTVGEFGVVDTLLLMSNAALLIGNAGIDSALMFFYYHVEDEQRKHYVATGFWLRVILGAIVASIGILAASGVNAVVFTSHVHARWTMLVFIVTPVTLAVTYFLDVLRIEHNRRGFLILSMVRLVLLLAGTWWVLLSFEDNRVEAFLFFRIVPEVVVLVLLLLFMRPPQGLGTFSRSAAKSILSYGLPLLPAAAMFWALGFVDRWFLFQSVSQEEVGIYALAGKIGMVFALFATAIQMAFNPYSMAIKDQKGAETLYTRAYNLTMLGAFIIVVFMGANLSWLIELFGGSEYAGAAIPASLFLVGGTLYIAFVFFSTGANIRKKTGYNAIAHAAALGSAVLLMVPLVPAMGNIGAALAIVVAYLVLAIVMFALSQRVNPVQYSIGSSSMALLMCVVTLMVMAMYPIENGVLSIVLKNILAAGVASGMAKIMLSSMESDKLFRYLRTFRAM